MYANFNWDVFFTLLKKKQIVPVIGSDLILIKTGKDISLKLTEHITNQLAKNLKLEFNNLSLSQFISKYQNSTMVKSLIKHIYNEINIEDIDFNPLRKLAEITDFDTFLTLNFDGFFEDTLKNIRNQQNIHVVNMSLESDRNNTVKGIEDALVFNIFGSIRSKQFAKTESDFLEYTFSLRNDKYENKLLSEKTKGKSFLFIGNDLPNWIIPTFMRSITNESFENAESIKFIAENEKDTVNNYFQFMNNYQIEYYRSQNNYKSNSLSFIDELYEKWTQYNSKQSPNFYNQSVFINAAPENFSEMTQLYDVLRKKGIEVFYNPMIDKNPYLFSKEVENQIKRSSIFISLISNESLNSEKEYAYHKELNVAKMRHSWFHDSSEDSFIEVFAVGEEEIKSNAIPEFLKTFNLRKFNLDLVVQNVIQKLNTL